MKKRLVVFLLACLSVTTIACGKDNSENEANSVASVEETTLASSEEISEVVDAVTEVTASSEEATAEPVSEPEGIEVNADYSEQYYGNTIDLSVEANEFSGAISESVSDGNSLASFVIDLDGDGQNEAIVIEGCEEAPDNLDADPAYKYWYVEKAWYVSDNKSVTELSDYDGSYIATKQYYLANGASSFIAINGYIGMDGVGNIYSVNDDNIQNAVSGAWLQGQKHFVSETEAVWEVESYVAYFLRMEGFTPEEMGGSGRCHLPYHMNLTDGSYHLYASKEVTLDDVMAIAELNTEEIPNLDSAQFILRDNNELEINYVVIDLAYYNFYSNIYYLSDDSSSWELKGTVQGFMDVNPGEKSNWTILSEKMK